MVVPVFRWWEISKLVNVSAENQCNKSEIEMRGHCRMKDALETSLIEIGFK